jgi:hypothetical protein
MDATSPVPPLKVIGFATVIGPTVLILALLETTIAVALLPNDPLPPVSGPQRPGRHLDRGQIAGGAIQIQRAGHPTSSALNHPVQ